MDVMKEDRGEIQCVTLGVDREIFAVPVAAVLEILDMAPICRVPDMPAYVAGIVNVRGRSVPAIDLRLKLGLPAAAATDNTRILVLEVEINGRPLVLGLIADRVFEVATLQTAAIEPPPEIGVRWRSDYLRGIGRHNDAFVIIFDLPRLFASEDVALMRGSAAITAGDKAEPSPSIAA